MVKIKQKDIWKTLSEIDVIPYAHEKGKNSKISYLPWGSAIGLVKPYYDIEVKIHENDGLLYFTDGKTCWVKVSVIIEGYEELEYLPIMNYSNRSILLKDITSVDVNKALKRAIVKCLASFGLGISLYAGDELPSTTEEEASVELLEECLLMKESLKDKKAFDDYVEKTYKAKIEELGAVELKKIKIMLENKVSKQ